MFSGHWYLSISLSIESLSAFQPQQEKEESAQTKREKHRESGYRNNGAN